MSIGADVTDYSAALIPGAWAHEFVAANGARFHVATAGFDTEGPLVVLIHTFGQFWWAWRHQIPALAAAGYRVAAVDLRGVAASDKPPSGYDVPTRTRDIAGMVRALGHSDAVVVGHGTGGEVAWAMAALQPALTRGVVALSCPHPARVHTPLTSMLTPAALRWLAAAQVPSISERRLRNTDFLDRLFAMGAGVPLLPDDIAVYRAVMRIPFAAHTALEPLRWMVRIQGPRPDGRRYTLGVRRGLTLPTVQVAGSLDGINRVAGIDTEGSAFSRDFRFTMLDGVGHYLPEEAPDEVNALLLEFMAGLG
ncbi:MAG: alpha/beta hydrolase [Cellulomonadaceae bacterium]|nr:alpha/beta hydrolase [Cellulomonadaceae bacterium]